MEWINQQNTSDGKGYILPSSETWEEEFEVEFDLLFDSFEVTANARHKEVKEFIRQQRIKARIEECQLALINGNLKRYGKKHKKGSALLSLPREYVVQTFKKRIEELESEGE